MNSTLPGHASRWNAIVRRARISDVEPVFRIAEAAPPVSRWSQAEYGAYCLSGSDLADAQVKALFVACVMEDFQTSSPCVIGFAAFSAVTTAGECELANMAVSPNWRRQGIASRLMAAGLLWCRARCFTVAPHTGVWLEVRASNRTAINFYQAAGFIRTGTRPAYYAQPAEDAILMQKILGASTGSGNLQRITG